MESGSRGEDLLHKQPDGTRLLVRRWGTGKRAVLILPALGESLSEGFYDRIASAILARDLTVYALELRGHDLSQGWWTLNAFRVDVAYWIATLSEKHRHVYVIASGLSASVMLEYEEQAHRMPDPPIPDGMLLLSPVFRGRDVLPELPRTFLPGGRRRALARIFARADGSHGFRRCRLDREGMERLWDELSAYVLPPVRVQTPSVMLVPTEVHANPLKRVFGSIAIRRVVWLHGDTEAGLAAHLAEVREAFRAVREAEKPIRFRSW